MIRIPATVAQAIVSPGEYRAGGTDVMDRRLSGVDEGDVVDLSRVGELRRIERRPDGSLAIGARVTLAEVARHPDLARDLPGLAGVAGAGATAQIRAVATLGGNLLQRPRCWYFRNPDFRCFRKGGGECFAATGDHSAHAIFARSPSQAVHASTLGMVLLAHEARVEVAGGEDRTIADLYGDGADPTREHTLEPGALLTAVVVPPPAPGERWGYKRAISRRRAEWPTVEAHVRLGMDGATIAWARVAAGAVANVPLRLPAVEDALAGRKATQEALAAAAERAADGAAPLPGNAHKVPLLIGTVLEALERAAGGEED